MAILEANRFVDFSSQPSLFDTLAGRIPVLLEHSTEGLPHHVGLITADIDIGRRHHYRERGRLLSEHLKGLQDSVTLGSLGLSTTELGNMQLGTLQLGTMQRGTQPLGTMQLGTTNGSGCSVDGQDGHIATAGGDASSQPIKSVIQRTMEAAALARDQGRELHALGIRPTDVHIIFGNKYRLPKGKVTFVDQLGGLQEREESDMASTADVESGDDSSEEGPTSQDSKGKGVKRRCGGRKLWEPKSGGQATPDPGSSDWYHWLAARADDKTAEGKAIWRAGGTLQREQLKAFQDHIAENPADWIGPWEKTSEGKWIPNWAAGMDKDYQALRLLAVDAGRGDAFGAKGNSLAARPVWKVSLGKIDSPNSFLADRLAPEPYNDKPARESTSGIRSTSGKPPPPAWKAAGVATPIVGDLVDRLAPEPYNDKLARESKLGMRTPGKSAALWKAGANKASRRFSDMDSRLTPMHNDSQGRASESGVGITSALRVQLFNKLDSNLADEPKEVEGSPSNSKLGTRSGPKTNSTLGLPESIAEVEGESDLGGGRTSPSGVRGEKGPDTPKSRRAWKLQGRASDGFLGRFGGLADEPYKEQDGFFAGARKSIWKVPGRTVDSSTEQVSVLNETYKGSSEKIIRRQSASGVQGGPKWKPASRVSDSASGRFSALTDESYSDHPSFFKGRGLGDGAFAKLRKKAAGQQLSSAAALEPFAREPYGVYEEDRRSHTGGEWRNVSRVTRKSSESQRTPLAPLKSDADKGTDKAFKGKPFISTVRTSAHGARQTSCGDSPASTAFAAPIFRRDVAKKHAFGSTIPVIRLAFKGTGQGHPRTVRELVPRRVTDFGSRTVNFSEGGPPGSMDGEQRPDSAKEEAQGNEERILLSEAIEEMNAEAEQNQAWSLEHGLTLIGSRKKARPARRRSTGSFVLLPGELLLPGPSGVAGEVKDVQPAYNRHREPRFWGISIPEGIASNVRQPAAVPAKSRLQYQLVAPLADGMSDWVHDGALIIENSQSEDAQAAAVTQPSGNPAMDEHGEESFSEALDFVLAQGHADSTAKGLRSSCASMGARVSFFGTHEGRGEIAGTAEGGSEAIGQLLGRASATAEASSVEPASMSLNRWEVQGEHPAEGGEAASSSPRKALKRVRKSRTFQPTTNSKRASQGGHHAREEAAKEKSAPKQILGADAYKYATAAGAAATAAADAAIGLAIRPLKSMPAASARQSLSLLNTILRGRDLSSGDALAANKGLQLGGLGSALVPRPKPQTSRQQPPKGLTGARSTPTDHGVIRGLQGITAAALLTKQQRDAGTNRIIS